MTHLSSRIFLSSTYNKKGTQSGAFSFSINRVIVQVPILMASVTQPHHIERFVVVTVVCFNITIRMFTVRRLTIPGLYQLTIADGVIGSTLCRSHFWVARIASYLCGITPFSTTGCCSVITLYLSALWSFVLNSISHFQASLARSCQTIL